MPVAGPLQAPLEVQYSHKSRRTPTAALQPLHFQPIISFSVNSVHVDNTLYHRAHPRTHSTTLARHTPRACTEAPRRRTPRCSASSDPRPPSTAARYTFKHQKLSQHCQQRLKYYFKMKSSLAQPLPSLSAACLHCAACADLAQLNMQAATRHASPWQVLTGQVERSHCDAHKTIALCCHCLHDAPWLLTVLRQHVNVFGAAKVSLPATQSVKASPSVLMGLALGSSDPLLGESASASSSHTLPWWKMDCTAAQTICLFVASMICYQVERGAMRSVCIRLVLQAAR